MGKEPGRECGVAGQARQVPAFGRPGSAAVASKSDGEITCSQGGSMTSMTLPCPETRADASTTHTAARDRGRANERERHHDGVAAALGIWLGWLGWALAPAGPSSPLTGLSGNLGGVWSVIRHAASPVRCGTRANDAETSRERAGYKDCGFPSASAFPSPSSYTHTQTQTHKHAYNTITTLHQQTLSSF